MTLGIVLLALSCFCFGLADSFPLYCCRRRPHRAGLLLRGHGPPLSGRGPLVPGPAGPGSGAGRRGQRRVHHLCPHTHHRDHPGPRACAPPFCWRALAVLVLAAGWSWLLVRDVPGDLGLEPYHLGGPDDSGAAAPPRAGGHDSRPPAVPAAGCLSHRRPRRARFLPPDGALHHRRL